MDLRRIDGKIPLAAALRRKHVVVRVAVRIRRRRRQDVPAAVFYRGHGDGVVLDGEGVEQGAVVYGCGVVGAADDARRRG